MKFSIPGAPSARPRGSRITCLLVVLAFAAPFVAAALLNLGGWQPSGKGYGKPILPQRNFEQEHLRLRLFDGEFWVWRDASPRMTLIALAGSECAVRCLDMLTKMAAARITLHHNMARLRLLYVGPPPAQAAHGMQNYWTMGLDVDHRLAAYRPTTPDSVSALLVESDGTALAQYPAGFDPSGLRKDLQKVIR